MTVYLVDLESISTRYTCEWKIHFPELLKQYGHDVVVISGPDDLPDSTTPGMFLNFAATNIYKAAQVEIFSRLFAENKVHDGDFFLFADAWHPGVINLRYMSDLLGVKIKIGGLWHAGSYDPQDGLGRLVGNKPWVRHSEIAFFEAFDYNYFATKFHVDLFTKTFFNQINDLKIVRTGWPMEYMQAIIESFSKLKKRDLILFPHRVAPEKQVEIFRDLAEHLPQYEFVVCQDTKLTKDEYHALLGQSKIVFSANLQETLGITTCAEGPLAGAIPLAPDRLSYSEIFSDYPEFLYPSNWTTDWDAYIANRDTIVQRIIDIMENYEQYKDRVDKYLDTTYPTYFNFAGIASDHAE